MPLTNAEILALGWKALVARLGPSDALRYTMLMARGHGDWTSAVRHRALGSESVDAVLRRMQRTRVPRRRTRR